MSLSPKTASALAYILNNYPHPADLSKARVLKMLYLADWVMAARHGHTITDIDWYFNHYGPYMRDIEDAVRSSSLFKWRSGVNMYGSPKETLTLRHSGQPKIDLDPSERQVIDRVIDRTQTLNFSEFLSLVYRTYPVKNSDKYTDLDLVALAKKFQQKKERNS